MTYNQIIELFEAIATNHWQIKSFGHGQMSEIEGEAASKELYPKLWVTPVDSTTKESTVERTFDVIIFDLVQKDKSNRDDVLSDTEQILVDVIKTIKNNSIHYELTNDPTANPFEENFGEDVTGWSAQVSIETDLQEGMCDIPSDLVVSITGGGNCAGSECGGSGLKCSDLPLCPTIIAIQDELINHEGRIEVLEAGGGGGGNQDLASVLGYGNKTNELAIISNNGLSKLSLLDSYTQIGYTTTGVDNYIYFDINKTKIGSNNYVEFVSPTVLIGGSNMNYKLYVESANKTIGVFNTGGQNSIEFLDGAGTAQLFVDYTNQLGFNTSLAPVYFGNFYNPSGNLAGFSVPGQVVMGVSSLNKYVGIGGGGVYFASNHPKGTLEVRGFDNNPTLYIASAAGQTKNIIEVKTSANAMLTSMTSEGVWTYAADYSGLFGTYSLIDKNYLTTQLGNYELLTNKATDYSTINNTKYPTTQATENRYALKQNGLTSGGVITIGDFDAGGTNNDVRISTATWDYNFVTYQTLTDTYFYNIALSASGLQRYVAFYGDTSNTIIKVEGTESEYATLPTQPANTVLIGYILVTDSAADSAPDLSAYLQIAPRTLSVASSATPTLNTNDYDVLNITALATNITSMTSGLSGSPANFQRLIMRIKDNGTSRTITWGTAFVAMGATLPLSTTISKTWTLGFLYNSATAKWGCVAAVQEA